MHFPTTSLLLLSQVLTISTTSLPSSPNLQRCGSTHLPSSIHTLHRAAAQKATENNLAQAQTPIKKFSISTYVHVISSGPSEAEGNVPQDKILAQINVMNRAYKSAGFTFLLRNITRTVSKEWYPMEYDSAQEVAIKSALRQGKYTDLNIYFDTMTTFFGGGLLGFSTFPDFPTSDIFAVDGIVIDPSTVPNGTFIPYNLGATAIHEAGPPFIPDLDGCQGDGDYVYDTPAEAYPAFGCPLGRDTCTGPSLSRDGKDPVRNYMDYSDDDCLNHFSAGQIDRMQVFYRQLRVEYA